MNQLAKNLTKEDRKVLKELVEFHRTELGSIETKLNQILAEKQRIDIQYRNIISALESGREKMKETILYLEGDL